MAFNTIGQQLLDQYFHVSANHLDENNNNNKFKKLKLEKSINMQESKSLNLSSRKTSVQKKYYYDSRMYQTCGRLNKKLINNFYQSNKLQYLNNFILLKDNTTPLYNTTPSMCVEFDDLGALVCLAREKEIYVVDFDVRLTEFTKYGKNILNKPITMSQVCRLNCNMKIDTIRWNPWKNTIIAAASNSRDYALLYCLNREKCIRKMTAYRCGAILDIKFARTSRSMLCGGSRNGEVSIWDCRRALSTPWKSLVLPNKTSRIQSIDISNDENVIYAFRSNGEIDTWDIRFSPTPLRSFQIKIPRRTSNSSTTKVIPPIHLSNGLKHPLYDHWLAFQLHDCSVGCFDINSRQLKCLWRPSTIVAEPDDFLNSYKHNTYRYMSSFLNPYKCPPLMFASTKYNTVSVTNMAANSLRQPPTQIHVPSPVLCTTSHPTMNYVVCGFSTGQFGVIGIESNQNNSYETNSYETNSHETNNYENENNDNINSIDNDINQSIFNTLSTIR